MTGSVPSHDVCYRLTGDHVFGINHNTASGDLCVAIVHASGKTVVWHGQLPARLSVHPGRFQHAFGKGRRLRSGSFFFRNDARFRRNKRAAWRTRSCRRSRIWCLGDRSWRGSCDEPRIVSTPGRCQSAGCCWRPDWHGGYVDVSRCCLCCDCRSGRLGDLTVLFRRIGAFRHGAAAVRKCFRRRGCRIDGARRSSVEVARFKSLRHLRFPASDFLTGLARRPWAIGDVGRTTSAGARGTR